MPKLPITVRAVETMPADAIVICAFDGQSYFADDVLAKCAQCGASIRHRPAMAAARTKLCMPCGHAFMAKNGITDTQVTREALDEAALLLRRDGGRA